MGNSFNTIKIKEDIYRKFKKAKNLKEFQLEKDISISEYLDHLLELGFKEFDNMTIKKENTTTL